MNANGIADMAGNVWEWTSTCYVRTTLVDDGKTPETRSKIAVSTPSQAFTALYVELHPQREERGLVIGLPPDNLGFMLVRETSAFPFLAFGRG